MNVHSLFLCTVFVCFFFLCIFRGNFYAFSYLVDVAQYTFSFKNAVLCAKHVSKWFRTFLFATMYGTCFWYALSSQSPMFE